MDYFGPPEALYWIRDALLCLVYLAGITAGVIALTRKKVVPGILAIVAFLFLGLEVLFRQIIWYGLANVMTDYASLNWVSLCLSAPFLILAGAALVAIVFLSAGKKASLPPPPGLDELPK